MSSSPSELPDDASVTTGVESLRIRGFKPKEPRKFKGESLNEYRDFVEDLEVYFRLSRITEEAVTMRILFASMYLEGQPKSLWRNRGGAERVGEYTWKSFKDFLQDSVEDPANRALTQQFKYNESRQGASQSVAVYAAHFESLEDQLPDDPETRRLLALYTRLRPEIRTALVTQGVLPKTRRELVEMASRIETAQKTAHHGNREQGRDKDKSKGRDKPKDQRQDKRNRSVDDSSTTGNRQAKRQETGHADVTCYACNKKGHYSTNCPEKGSEKPRGPGNASYARRVQSGDSGNGAGHSNAPRSGPNHRGGSQSKHGQAKQADRSQ